MIITWFHISLSPWDCDLLGDQDQGFSVFVPAVGNQYTADKGMNNAHQAGLSSVHQGRQQDTGNLSLKGGDCIRGTTLWAILFPIIRNLFLQVYIRRMISLESELLILKDIRCLQESCKHVETYSCLVLRRGVAWKLRTRGLQTNILA